MMSNELEWVDEEVNVWMKWNETKRNEMKQNRMEWNEWMNEWMSEWVNAFMNEMEWNGMGWNEMKRNGTERSGTDEWMDEWMNEWVNEWISEKHIEKELNILISRICWKNISNVDILYSILFCFIKHTNMILFLFLYLSMDFWYGCSGRQVLVYLGVPDSAVVLIQRSKTVPSNEKTFWEFEKNVSENNMEKKHRENESLFPTKTSSCHMATESQSLVFAQFHGSCLTSPTSTEKRLQGSFIDEGRKTRKKFQQEEPLKQFFPPIKKMGMVDTAMLISVEEWDSIYIYIYIHTYKSRVAVHQRFRGSKEFQLSGWFTQGFSGHSTCFFGSYLSSACARLRVGHCH